MIRINLLPIRAAKRKEHVRKHGILLVVYVVFLFTVVLGIQMSLMSEEESRRQDIERKKKEIVALDLKIKEVQNYKAKLADLTDKVNTVKNLEQSQRGPAKVFLKLSSVIPEKVWIEKMNDDRGAVVMEGFAIDQQTIAQFMMNLEGNPSFKNVRLSVTKKVMKGGVEMQGFTILANVLMNPVEKAPAAKAGKAG